MPPKAPTVGHGIQLAASGRCATLQSARLYAGTGPPATGCASGCRVMQLCWPAAPKRRPALPGLPARRLFRAGRRSGCCVITGGDRSARARPALCALPQAASAGRLQRLVHALFGHARRILGGRRLRSGRSSSVIIGLICAGAPTSTRPCAAAAQPALPCAGRCHGQQGGGCCRGALRVGGRGGGGRRLCVHQRPEHEQAGRWCGCCLLPPPAPPQCTL